MKVLILGATGFNIGVTGTDAPLREGNAISLRAAHFEPQAVPGKLWIKLTVDGGMNA